MIIIASQRGGTAKLAAHLLNDWDNDHVELYEVSGFMSETLDGALKEARAQAMSTCCNQYLFFVSLNPPEKEKVKTDVFKRAISRIEERMNLQGQPRVIVFHEKKADAMRIASGRASTPKIKQRHPRPVGSFDRAIWPNDGSK